MPTSFPTHEKELLVFIEITPYIARREFKWLSKKKKKFRSLCERLCKKYEKSEVCLRDMAGLQQVSLLPVRKPAKDSKKDRASLQRVSCVRKPKNKIRKNGPKEVL